MVKQTSHNTYIRPVNCKNIMNDIILLFSYSLVSFALPLFSLLFVSSSYFGHGIRSFFIFSSLFRVHLPSSLRCFYSSIIFMAVTPPVICFYHFFEYNSVNVNDNISNPYFLHQGDSPGTALVSLLLTGCENYYNRGRTVSMALVAINGSIKQPMIEEPSQGGWIRCYCSRSWIKNSVPE